MLRNRDGTYTGEVIIPVSKWRQIIDVTKAGIIRKLMAASVLVEVGDLSDLCAGIYTFALEEFGKLLTLENCQPVMNGTKVRIPYSSEFTNHDKKFEKAFDYLQSFSETSYKCYVLNDTGSFSPKSFTWKCFNIGLVADFEARLSILYSDFSYKKDEEGINTTEVDILVAPEIISNYLKNAIAELRTVLETRAEGSL